MSDKSVEVESGYRVEQMLVEKLGDDLLQQIYGTNVYSVGALPYPHECIEMVHEYGDEMWDMIADIEGDHMVAERIMGNGLSKVESFTEFCVSFVALVMGETAWHRGQKLGWDEE